MKFYDFFKKINISTKFRTKHLKLLKNKYFNVKFDFLYKNNKTIFILIDKK